ncbi:phosphonate ABC transporter, permease protein PhnE [Natronosalvus caseinilyticus]|uniref:phosphonate ABC transporter, permease protein PhnE n=1 Tax=Natronosalvus caseinilyticus TaxID=2953747 RepID=UPI0028A89EAB|nr:phosphonate ABC transporter, permease protein PhnE [Natronosalvus caseinilyticus]
MTDQSTVTDTSTEWDTRGRKRRFARYVGLLTTFVVVAISWRALNVRYEYVETAPESVRDLLNRMYPPDAAYANEIVGPLLETINIAVLGTGLAILLALPVAFIGAENTTPNRATYLLGKFLIVASRSVNVIIWAIIFVFLFGTSALAGVLAVGFRSIGFVAKLIAEEIEEINPTQVEAVRATGASRTQTLLYGIVPQVKPAFVGVSVYRWDINVRSSTIIGFVGAGGIGMELQNSIDFLDWHRVLTILIAILAVVLVSELISAYLRSKVR